MAVLDHARRTLERATFTQIKAPERPSRPTGRAWDKWSFVAALSATRAEWSGAVVHMVRTSTLPEDQAVHLQKLGTMLPEADDEAPASLPLELAPQCEPISPEVLSALGTAIMEQRRVAVDAARASVEALVAAATKVIAAPTPPIVVAVPPELKLDGDAFVPMYPGAKIYRSETATPISTPRPGHGTESAGASGSVAESEFLMIKPPPAEPEAQPHRSLAGLTMADLIALAGQDSAAAAAAQNALTRARQLGIAGAALDAPTFMRSMSDSVNATQDVLHYFAKRMQVEPVGMLHLERVGFTPAGIERGELIHSVPLSPAEHVNITHKEWSTRSEEFQNIVTDFLEEFSEQGVAEKSELTQSTNSQSAHSMGFSLGVTASGGYGPVSISTSTNFNIASSSSQSEQVARNQSSELTRRASSRSKKEHKISFKVASASGTSDQSVREIINPFPDKAARVDYYQLIRRWQVDLFRYGVRLTYDLAISEPGSQILARIMEIDALSAALRQGFNAEGATASWARFDLKVGEVKRNNYSKLAAQYGTVVSEPPPDSIKAYRSFTAKWADKSQAEHREWNSFEIEVPDGYEVIGAKTDRYHWQWDEDDAYFAVTSSWKGWHLTTGSISLTVGTQYQQAYDIQLTLRFGLTDAAYHAWQMKVWGQLYEAAKARYELNRTMLRDQLSALQEQLGAQDALSLRQIEREEVMKNVLRWLFGPDSSFRFVAPGTPENLYKSNQTVLSDKIWARVMAQGEVIKFLHHAIEWENMLYILYPYFWSHVSRWEFKKYLDHPDFIHRSFLRAGSARVVLTIRPGFETDFVKFLETGTLDPSSSSSPYMTVAEEMQAYAQTNYPGIRSANPDQEARPLLSPLQQRAWDEMQKMIALLETYKTSNGAYPTTAQGLAELAGLGNIPAADPWGNPYHYESPGLYAEFQLSSYGADGVPGGIDENADINSWARSSLIGRWYEYTPTSALDIAFNETLPTA